MAETKTVILKRLVNHYVSARAHLARLQVGGIEVKPGDSSRWDLVNAQHNLAEFIANEWNL